MYHGIPWYDELKTDDISKFEKGLIRWCNLSKVDDKNFVMLFDESSLNKIVEKLQQRCDIEQQRCIQTDNLVIRWRCIGGEKAILESIIDTNNGETLYAEPPSWKDAKTWYGF